MILQSNTDEAQATLVLMLSRLVSVTEILTTSFEVKAVSARKPLFTKKVKRIVLPAEVKKAKRLKQVSGSKDKDNYTGVPNHPQWKESTMKDKHLGPILKAKLGERKVVPTSTLGKLLPEFEVVDNTLCLKRGGVYRAAVPLQFRRQLMTV